MHKKKPVTYEGDVMDVKFSIIIPAYNAAKYISQTLDSVRDQKYKNYEVIIVNDGSKDNTEDEIKSYIDKNPEMDIHYIAQENGGVSAARYRCGQEASGDYLAFLDADDIWYPDKLTKVVELIEKNRADVIYHDFVEVATDGKSCRVSARTLNEDDPLSDLIINGNALATSATCVCMRLYKEIDPFVSKLSAYEDYECWIKYAAAGAKFSHICECLSEYKRNENSLTLVNDKYIIDSYNNQLTFLKYLDGSKFTKKQLEDIKKKIKLDCDYVLARSYHKQGKYKEAICFYNDVIKGGKITFKSIGAYFFALLRIRK